MQYNHLKILTLGFVALLLFSSVFLFTLTLTRASVGSNTPQTPHNAAARFVFSQDGNTLASLEEGGWITVLDLASGQERAILARPSSGVVTGLALSPDGKILASVAEDTITLWEVASGQEHVTLAGSSSGVVTGLAFSPDGKTLAGVADHTQILVWEVESGSQQWVLSSGGNAVSKIAFSPDGTILASRGKDERIKLWNMAFGQEHLTLTNPMGAAITGLVFSPDGMTLASVDVDANITLWDPKSGYAKQILTGHQDLIIKALAFSPDGSLLASGGKDTQITLRDVVSGQDQWSLPSHFDTPVTGLVFSPDGTTFVSMGEDPRIMVRDVSTGTLRQILIGHNDLVAEVAFSSSKQTLASVGRDGQVIVWKLATASDNTNSNTSSNFNLSAPIASFNLGAPIASELVNDPRMTNASSQTPTAVNATRTQLGDCSSPPNPIVAENCQTGNPSTEWDITGFGDSSIQGFATEISVNRGETVFFKIKTDASNYRLDLYRMGYYDGMGARKVATVQPSATLPQTQPDCLTNGMTGLIDCGNWAVSAYWPVPANATSGIYFAKLVRTDTGEASHLVFIVRDDTSMSDLLFQTSDTTWQAYNIYGGNSLYVGSPAGRAYKVSYNRPFSTRVSGTPSWLFNAEYPMIRWLEANGYNVSYFTGVDSDRRGNLIRNHKVFLSVGHDEYWSGAQRANVEAARNAGIHLAFFSGNEVFWKTRWENSIDGTSSPYRTLVCYKETHDNAKVDPSPQWTGTWRDPRFSPPADGGRPENALTGTIFMVNDGATTAIKVPEADGKMRFWRNTSIATLAPGSTATLPFGTLGYEWDEDLDNGFRPAGLIRMSTTTASGVPYLQNFGSKYEPGTATHHLTLYRHTSGALVFGAGTVQWSWGLDSNHDRGSAAPDVRMQQATVNLLADTGVQPANLQSGLVPATASTDTIAPSSTIVSPTAGSSVPQGSAVTISGTATDTGGVVGGVEVSVDGGSTWHPANGRANWSYIWNPSASGSVTIKSRSVDDSGNLETPGAGVTVTVGGSQTCPCSGWSPSTTPGTPAVTSDKNSVELGVKFTSDVGGFITSIRFYKGSTNTGTHTGTLWTSTGQQLATATFSNETPSGWQQVNFANPVAIQANTVYVASYHAPNGNYAVDRFYFANSGVDNVPLHFLRDGVSGGNGVYIYSTSTAFPTNTYQSTNYWVDVVFTTSGGPDATKQELKHS
jgi:WD40 repeat protein